MEGHSLLGNGPVNTSRGNKYAKIGCPVQGNAAVNILETVEERCFLYGSCRNLINKDGKALGTAEYRVQSEEP
jgi:hypothetical protein